MKVLFVCVGNMCRSPLLERLFEVYAEKRNFECEVESAGLIDHAKPMSENSVAVLKERGIEPKTHISKLVAKDLVAGSDLVVAMTDRIRDKVVDKFGCADKVVSLSDDRLLGKEVEDPYGFDMTVYRRVGDDLARACQYILRMLEEIKTR